MAQRIRERYDEAIPSRFQGGMVGGQIHIGGRRKNMHEDRRDTRPQQFPAARMIERDSGQVQAKPIDVASMEESAPCVRRLTEPGPQANADGSSARYGLRRPAQAAAHKRCERAREEVSTNGIASFSAGRKRGYHGVNHW